MPTTNAITKRYYPTLSEVITVDDLPEFLHFAEDGLNSLLDKIYYKNLQYSKSRREDAAFYSLEGVDDAKNIAKILRWICRNKSNRGFYLKIGA